jgi:hypothetical protein
MLECKPGWAKSNSFDISVEMLGTEGVGENEERVEEVRIDGISGGDAVELDGKGVRGVCDDY